MLIVITGTEDALPYQVNVRTHVDESGDMEFDLYGLNTALNDDSWQLVPIDFSIIFVSETLKEEIACGSEGSQAQDVRFTDLNTTAQDAVVSDYIGGEFSATNYGKKIRAQVSPSPPPGGPILPTPHGTEPKPSPEPNIEEVLSMGEVVDFKSHSETIGLLGEAPKGSGRWKDKDYDKVFSEHCRIPASYIWRSSKSSLFEQSARKTMMFPQFNFLVEGRKEIPEAYGLNVTTVVDTQPGHDMVGSFPNFEVGYNVWSTAVSAHVYEKKMLFTAHPMLLLENRDAAQRKEVVLIIYGALAGGSGTLLVLAFRLMAEAHYMKRDQESHVS